MNRTALAVLALATLACNRGSAPPPAAEVARKLAEAASAPAPAELDPKPLLTDGKVGQYIVYQTEMNLVADLAMGAAAQAYAKSGGSQKGFEKSLSQDERTRKIADTEASALAKSGLSRAEAMALAKVVSSYTPGATMGDAEMKQKHREAFSAKHGPEALAVMEKRLPELTRLQEAMLQAALGKVK